MACQGQTQVCSNLCPQGIVAELSEPQSHSSISGIQNSLDYLELPIQRDGLVMNYSPLLMAEKFTTGWLSKRYCNGIMGVPITVIDKLNPKQFDIIGCSSSWMIAGIEGSMPSASFMELVNKGKVRTGGTPGKSKVCWVDKEGFANVGYHRIFLRKKV